MISNNEFIRDRQLVDGCVGGDPDSWDEIYRRYHDRLLTTIRTFTCGKKNNPELVDEIAARVWFSIVDNQGRLLDRFDPERGCPLIAFLTGIAKFETLNFFRSERRIKRREEQASHDGDWSNQSQWDQLLEIDDFSKLLTPGEKDYLGFELHYNSTAEQTDARGRFSDTSRWQFRSRIQRKLKSYSNDDCRGPD